MFVNKRQSLDEIQYEKSNKTETRTEALIEEDKSKQDEAACTRQSFHKSGPLGLSVPYNQANNFAYLQECAL